MSYVEKIMSDIIQTTSDLFSVNRKHLKNKTLRYACFVLSFMISKLELEHSIKVYNIQNLEVFTI